MMFWVFSSCAIVCAYVYCGGCGSVGGGLCGCGSCGISMFGCV